MDKKEFLKELDGRGFDFQDKSYTEFGFNDEILNMVYEMYCAGQQAQAVPEGFALVRKELPESIAETLALDRVAKPVGNEIDPIWIEITENVYKEHLRSKKWELWRDYKAMIEAQEPAND